MSNRPGTPARIACRRVSAVLLTAAAGLVLAACESPFSPEYNGSADRYYESLVAREIMRGTYGTEAMNGGTFPTVVEPVREATTATGPATTTGPSLARASLIGVRSATLRMNEPVVGLSLQEAIARTVKHSLAIRVESYNPAIKESLIHEAEANFDAVAFGNSQWARTDEPLLSLSNSNGQTWTNVFGIKQILPTGTQIQASTGFNMRDVTGTASTPPGKSYYTANLNLQLVQPLLRGFGADVNEATIYLAQRDLRISLAQFKQQVIASVGDVEEAYMNLVLARTNVEVLERLVVASEQTYNDVEARKGIDATKASINQALTALESRRSDLHDAQKSYRAASDKLKSLLNDPDLDINSNILINPIDRPVADAISYEALECIQTALRQRPEMQQARLQLEKSDIVLKVARNDLLPKLDLTVAFQSNGLDRGLDAAYGGTINPMNALDETVALKFEMPLGNRFAESEVDRRQNERRQVITNMVQAAQQVVLDVKTQLREVYSEYDLIDYKDRVRKAAAEQFQGIIDLENIRPRTPEFLQLKLDSQANLAQSELQITQVIVNYNLAIMRLERAKGTLLEYDRISLDKAPPPRKNDLKDVLQLPGSTIVTD